MTLLHYIDNEVPWDAPSHYGEWDAIVENGGSTIVQFAAAAHPDRGGTGLRVTVADTGLTAYAGGEDLGFTIAPGGTIYLGVWLNLRTVATGSTGVVNLYNSSGLGVGLAYITSAHALQCYAVIDGGGVADTPATGPIDALDWVYYVVAIHRAATNVSADGYVAHYLNGVYAGSSALVDNYDIAASLDKIWIGCTGNSSAGFVLDFDEIRLAESYPEPFVPAPEGEYLTARRLCVLYRPADDDSCEFARYCADEMGVPRANLIPLPDATDDETLADYAAFQTQVENGIDAYFALNPTVAANCAAFLVGYGVPGYFMHAGAKHSATSRLNHYGTAFSSGTDNPLYGGEAGMPEHRLAVSLLRSHGLYLATRCDADTLAGAKALIDRAGTVAALAQLPDSDKLYSDDSVYRASLACRHLRIQSADYADFTELSNDAFVLGHATGVTFGSAGSRVAFADTSAESASSLRIGGEACRSALFTAGYAAAMGFAESAETFDAESFFEMLRIGGTFAESALVASAKVDGAGVAVGSGLLTVNFQQAGTNVYLAEGDLEQVNWNAPAGYARAGEETPEVHATLAAGRRYVLAVRKVSQHGVEERNTHVIAYVELDEQGSLLSPPLAEPADVTAELQPDGAILLGFSYVPPAGFASATSFEVFSDAGSGTLNLQTPVATITDVGAGRTDFEILVTPVSLPTKLAVRAVAAGRIGPLSRVVTVAAGAAPSAPLLL